MHHFDFYFIVFRATKNTTGKKINIKIVKRTVIMLQIINGDISLIFFIILQFRINIIVLEKIIS